MSAIWAFLKKTIAGERVEDETATGERRLLVAVLARAIYDYRVFYLGKRGSKKDREWGEDAKEWLFSKEKGPFSFLWVCDVLELKPSEIRRFAKYITEKQAACLLDEIK